MAVKKLKLVHPGEVLLEEFLRPKRAYDFNFAKEADQQLNRAGWRP